MQPLTNKAYRRRRWEMRLIATIQKVVSKKYLIRCLWLKTYLEVKNLMPLNKIGCRGVRGILSSSFGIFSLALVAGTAQGQTLLSVSAAF